MQKFVELDLDSKYSHQPILVRPDDITRIRELNWRSSVVTLEGKTNVLVKGSKAEIEHKILTAQIGGSQANPDSTEVEGPDGQTFRISGHAEGRFHKEDLSE